jgi:endonuclease YncB( thermonuclease family)
VSNPRSHARLAKYLGITTCLLVTVFLITGFCSAGQLKVSRVTDGDTITVRDDKVEKIIRLVGIDTPEISHKKRESSQPFGEAATKYLRDWC